MSDYKFSEPLEVDEVFEPYLAIEGEAADKEVYKVSEDCLKPAYRSAVKDLHPDTGGHQEAFKRMKDSYEELDELIDGSVRVIRERPSGTNQGYDPDYQVNQDGFIQQMDEVIQQLEQTAEKMDRNIEEQIRLIAGEELDLMEKVSNGELDPKEIDIEEFTGS